MDNAISSTVMTITPELAKEWLQNNKHPKQRSIRPNRVAEFARAMRDGKWVLNGESLIFSKEGCILTGQHRLLACVMANTAFQTVVTFGVENKDDSTFISIGNNISKSGADIAKEAGYTANLDQLMSSAGLLYSYENGNVSIGTGGIKNGSNLERLECLKRHPDLVESIKYVNTSVLKKSRTALSLIHYIGSKKHPTETEKFLEQVKLGVDLEEGSPALLLRDRILIEQTAALRKELHIRTGYRFAIAIKAYNMYIKDKKLKNLIFNPSKEEFPILINDDIFGSLKKQQELILT